MFRLKYTREAPSAGDGYGVLFLDERTVQVGSFGYGGVRGPTLRLTDAAHTELTKLLADSRIPLLCEQPTAPVLDGEDYTFELSCNDLDLSIRLHNETGGSGLESLFAWLESLGKHAEGPFPNAVFEAVAEPPLNRE